MHLSSAAACQGIICSTEVPLSLSEMVNKFQSVELILAALVPAHPSWNMQCVLVAAAVVSSVSSLSQVANRLRNLGSPGALGSSVESCFTVWMHCSSLTLSSCLLCLNSRSGSGFHLQIEHLCWNIRKCCADLNRLTIAKVSMQTSDMWSFVAQNAKRDNAILLQQ